MYVLITGGAGFIGSHVADCLLRAGHTVRALDNLCLQVHPDGSRPDYLDPEVELIQGDVRDKRIVEKSLKNTDAVIHLAAAVGVGQSMYEIDHYTDVNNRGTAVLLECLIRRPVERLVVASSMSIYGEGLYQRNDGSFVEDCERTIDQLRNADWEVHDEQGRTVNPVHTPESKKPCLSSVYALSKYDQERLCLMIGRTYDIPVVALRFFNAYGTRQALTNPYTGVLAIFASRLLNNRPTLIFEDGRQRRDFVSVYDIAEACRLTLEKPEAAGQVFNIGSGRPFSIREVARKLAHAMNKDIEPEIIGRYRAGDIRHCYADISRARDILGYRSKVWLESGLQELAEWLQGQHVQDHAEKASAELAARGLTL